MKALDYDGDGVIDELEWTSQLYRLPALKVRAPPERARAAPAPHPAPSLRLDLPARPPAPARALVQGRARAFGRPATGKVMGLRR